MPPSASYLNFDLLITRAGDRYRALVVDAPGGDADIFFDLPPSLPGFQELLALTGPRRGLRETSVTTTAPSASLDDVGRLLYDAIFQGEVRDVLVASQREATDNAAGLRLRLRFNEDAAELATLPWEILYDGGQERFLALSENLPILRYLSLPRPRPALVTKPPLRILAVLASPDGLDELNLDGEWQVLAEALSSLVDDGKVVLERLAAPTPSALQGRLLGDPVHVLHFVGHGVFDEESKQGMLVLADERNQPKLMGARELATLLANHTSLRLLYLNACEGALGDDGNVFAGLAQRLVQQGIPAAIAMQAEISDKAGIDLARTFYTALATGRPVDAALTQARVTLAMNSSVEWATPVLFSRAPDNRLFDIRDVLPTPECPYPGMKPFREDQQAYFFGRNKEIDDAVNRLAKHPFLAVVGPSGSGKSSLVYAGILPALRASRRFGPGPWTVHTLRPSDSRTDEGKAAPMKALSQLGDLSPQSPITSHQSPTLLIIDQFEETFTLADAAEARAFLDAVHGLIGRPNLYILLTVRADFYPNMMAMGDLWDDVQARRLELKPLGEDELWSAIVEPAARVGVEVEDALATALIADARGEAGVLPLVQETLVRLWEKVEGRQLGRSAYRKMGDGGRSGIQVAINDHADDLYHTLPAEDRPIARRIFLRLIQFGSGRADTRRQQTVAELRAGGDDPVRFDETLRALVDGRLLTTSGEESDLNRRVDISHEALIGGWALLQGWINEKRIAESTRRRLEDKVTEWLRLDQSGGLLDEYELLEVEAWLASGYSEDLGYPQALVDLKDASRAALASTEAEKTEAERTRQRSRVLAGGLALAALVIALVGYFAWIANNARGKAEVAASAEAVARLQADADREIAVTAEAEARQQAQLAAQAEATAVAAKAEVERLTRGIRADQLTLSGLMQHAENPELALLLGVEGLRIQNDVPEEVSVSALGRVYELLQRSGVGSYSGHGGNVTATAFSPNSQWLASGSADSTIRLWSLQQFQPESVILRGHSDVVTALAFSPDSQWLTSASEDGAVLLWDLQKSPAVSSRLPRLDVTVNALTFSPDNRWLAAVGETFTAFVWYMQSPSRAPVQFGEKRNGRITSIAIDARSRWIATGSEDRAVRLWRLGDAGVEPVVLTGHVSKVTALAFSPTQDLLASASEDNTVRLWNLTQDEEPFILRGHAGSILNLRFSPDGNWIATGSEDKTVRLWDVTRPGNMPSIFHGHAESVEALAFDPDGEKLTTISADATVRIWHVGDPETIPLIIQSGNRCKEEKCYITTSFSPDGHWLMFVGGDNAFYLWHQSVPDLIQFGCQLSGRNLKAAEWQQFFPSNTYQKTCEEWPVERDVAQQYVERGRDLAQHGKTIEAKEQFEIALSLDPSLSLVPAVEAERLAFETQQIRGKEPVQVIGLDMLLPINWQTGAIVPQFEDPMIFGSTGTGWVRINMALGPWTSPSDTTRYNGMTWEETYSRIIEGLSQHGVQVYGLIGTEAVPQYPGDRFRSGPSDGVLASKDPWVRSYVANTLTILKMFHDVLPIIETINEPDDWHLGYTNWFHPGWMAVIHQELYQAVKSDPELRGIMIVSGPLQGLDISNNAAARYLQRVYEEGKRMYRWGSEDVPFPFDGIGYHIYMNARMPQEFCENYRMYIDDMQRVVIEQEGKLKPLYLSEIGWSSEYLGEEYQSEMMSWTLNTIVRDRSVAMAFLFSLQDFVGAHYGLYRANSLMPESQKPAYHVFRSILSGEILGNHCPEER